MSQLFGWIIKEKDGNERKRGGIKSKERGKSES